ncbi:hypothetical protein [Maribacter sp. 4G9]|uniref:hypothetical protein n=1 Tax=Maribacter sp. 4G9 TaxID=1889777 RepID=UPI000C15205C|nr:hypothetical protein [Maribacter sp. 4G9]PIB31446.1 hypothetical protein BFP75_01480 [Maribacter sp. 4G9]
MKRTLSMLIMLIPLLAISQIPVTDAATNASIGMVNSQLTSINIQLKAVNKNLGRLINLMEKNNNNNRKAKEILKEELEAKKKAPDYVMKSTDVSMTLDLKDRILEAYRTSKNTIQELEYLERDEIQEFTLYTANAILESKNLFRQCNDIIKTKSIILPEERLKKVNGINTKLEQLLDGLITYNNKLSQISAFREARKSLINMNKN